VLAQKLPPGLGALAGCEQLPGGIELAQLILGARKTLEKGADGWALAFAIAEHAQADYAIVPARGRLLWAEGGDAKLLVPGDSSKVAQAAINLGGALVLGLHTSGSEEILKGAINRRQRFVDLVRTQSPDMSTLAVARVALAHDIPVYFPTPATNLIQLGQGRYGRLVTETVLDPQSTHAQRLARDKWLTKERLAKVGMPTLRSHLVKDADQAVAAAREIGGPVVLKPSAGGKGHGISLNLTDEKQIRRGFEIAARYGQHVLVEQFAVGDDHRVTVINGKMVAAAKRVPATVTGDGKRTVRELIDVLNADPRRGAPFEKLMERVRVDERVETLLGQQGLSLDAVPARGKVVKVTLAANVSQGGTAIDVTDLVHPDNRLAIELAARMCHARVAGVDFFTPDISQSWRRRSGWILEVNTSPGLRPHWIANPEQDLMTPILRVAFPEGARSRVPSAAITGSMGKTTTCQMLAHLARTAGRHPALSTTQGTWSGNDLLKVGDAAGGLHTLDLLTDPAVDFAIAELARGGMNRSGMVIDATDVVAVLNLTNTHVGLDGIETREDLAEVKAIPVRRAREWVFLYADEPLVLRMRDKMAPGVQLGLVSRDPANKALVAHRKKGGCTVSLEGKGKTAKIVIRQGEQVEFELKASAIPASEGGTSAAITENAMFAAAMALKLGLTGEEVAAGLRGFVSDVQQNPGRHNHLDGLPFECLLTWADGVAPLEELIARLDHEKHRGVRHLYMIVPGNRTDEWIVEMGRRAAGHFDRYWCAELVDLRGREPGEAAGLIGQGLREGGVAEDAIVCLAGDERTLAPVLTQVEPGAHMTVMVYDTAMVMRELDAFRRGLDTA
jgi:cyanophycin synthetase